MPPKKVATPKKAASEDSLRTADLTTIEGLQSVLLAHKINSLFGVEAEANPTFAFRGGEHTLLENLMYADHDVTEATRFLLKRKASTRMGDPLAHAVYNGKIGAIKALLENKALVNGNGGKKSEGIIPLLCVAKNLDNPVEALKQLLGTGALVLNKKHKKNNYNFFHTAAATIPETEEQAIQRLAAVEAVAQELQSRIAGGAKISNFINGKDKLGNTALMYASKKGDVDLIRVLIKYGASRTAKDGNGNTAVDVFSGSEDEKKEAFKRIYKGKVTSKGKAKISASTPDREKSAAQLKREAAFRAAFGTSIPYPYDQSIAYVNQLIKDHKAGGNSSSSSAASTPARRSTPKGAPSKAQLKREEDFKALFPGKKYPHGESLAFINEKIREAKAQAKAAAKTPSKAAAKTPSKTPSKAVRAKAAKAAKAAAAKK